MLHHHSVIPGIPVFQNFDFWSQTFLNFVIFKVTWNTYFNHYVQVIEVLYFKLLHKGLVIQRTTWPDKETLVYLKLCTSRYFLQVMCFKLFTSSDVLQVMYFKWCTSSSHDPTIFAWWCRIFTSQILWYKTSQLLLYRQTRLKQTALDPQNLLVITEFHCTWIVPCVIFKNWNCENL